MEATTNVASIFDKQKYACLQGVDFSRKGSIDIAIADLVTTINKQNHLFTTSSCSGRIIVFENWLFTSHEAASLDNVIGCLQNHEGNAVFKFEPMILHIQSRSLQDAQKLLHCAVASGFRNSGISIGNRGKIITAVRSTHSLEVPLSHEGTLMVTDKYLKFLTNVANDKMAENIQRISRFSQNLRDLLNEKDTESSSQSANKSLMKRSTDQSDRSTVKKSPKLSSSSEGEEDKSIDPSDVLSDCFLLDDTEIT
ncbi:hypothetical protein ScPMuIL_004744 [Solemya velum]